MPRPRSASGCGLDCWAPLTMPGRTRRRKGCRAGLPCSSIRARRSNGWRRHGWRRSWLGGRFLSGGAGWYGPSWPHAGPSSLRRTAMPAAASWAPVSGW
eukprot:15460234-Alexandrium_andersonii.AAC.1